MLMKKVEVYNAPIKGGVAYIPLGAKCIGQIKDEKNHDRLVFIIERSNSVVIDVDDPIFNESN